MKPVRKASFRSQDRHAVSAHQGNAEGDVADRRQALDSVCRRGSCRRRYYADDIITGAANVRLQITLIARRSSRPSLRRRASSSCSSSAKYFAGDGYLRLHRQPEPLGLGHAVLCAEAVVGDEPFAVILADDLIDAEQSGSGS